MKNRLRTVVTKWVQWIQPALKIQFEFLADLQGVLALGAIGGLTIVHRTKISTRYFTYVENVGIALLFVAAIFVWACVTRAWLKIDSTNYGDRTREILRLFCMLLGGALFYLGLVFSVEKL